MASLVERLPPRVQAAGLRAIYALPASVRRVLAGKPILLDGQQLAPDIQLLLRMMELSHAQLGGGDVAEARERMAGSAVLPAPDCGDVAVRSVHIPSDDGTIAARLYTPAAAADPSPLLLFYHGGGFVLGDLDSHDTPCRYLATRADVRVLAVDYRLAPEHPFPAAVDDALAAFRYAVDEGAALGVDPTAVAVGGDSAGGNLAAVVAHQIALTGGPGPVFLLMFYPCTDCRSRSRSVTLFGDRFFLTSEAMDWFLDRYCPDRGQRADERISIAGAADLSGLPPCYLATAGFDPLRDEGETLGKRLADVGVPVVHHRQSDLIHGFINFLGVGPRPAEALAEGATALRTGLALRPKAG